MRWKNEVTEAVVLLCRLWGAEIRFAVEFDGKKPEQADDYKALVEVMAARGIVCHLLTPLKGEQFTTELRMRDARLHSAEELSL